MCVCAHVHAHVHACACVCISELLLIFLKKILICSKLLSWDTHVKFNLLFPENKKSFALEMFDPDRKIVFLINY